MQVFGLPVGSQPDQTPRRVLLLLVEYQICEQTFSYEMFLLDDIDVDQCDCTAAFNDVCSGPQVTGVDVYGTQEVHLELNTRQALAINERGKNGVHCGSIG